MAIITFMSDFGRRDHYVAAVKAKIFQYNPSAQIVDISHEITPFDIAHGAFVLSSIFRDFPAGSVHLVAVNSQLKSHEKFIAVKMEEHFFVGTDNGIFSLVSEKVPTSIVELNGENDELHSFSAKNILAPAATALANGKNIYDLGRQLTEINTMLNRQLRITRNAIVGNVVHVDGFGNLITNISRNAFNQFWDKRSVVIGFGRHKIYTLHQSYSSVEEGECVVFFNSLNMIEIAINKGSASMLLGLEFDSPITINFVPEY